jgi:calcineurin-like phosphoesterase family protein
MIWFTADTHFGHEKLIVNTHRPFANAFEMDNTLIANWNKVVKDNDMVYHLGDFCWTAKPLAWEHYIAQLNGEIILIKGNHDLKRRKIAYLFQEVEYIKQVKWEKQKITLCHYAMRHWDRSHFGTYQLHGHAHGTLESIGKQLDVGVDCHNYYPISIERVFEIMETKPDNPEIDHHRRKNGR